jgi:adenine phosphoribosyltransferase
MASAVEWIASMVRTVPDFPRPGVLFRDLTPLLADADGLRTCVEAIAERLDDLPVDRVIGIEARGFLFAAPLAFRLGVGMVPMRKAGKLPGTVLGEDYDLEYGTERLEVGEGMVQPGDRIVVVDDVLATGGTADAAIRLVERVGGEVVTLAFILELLALDGRARLAGRPVLSLVEL